MSRLFKKGDSGTLLAAERSPFSSSIYTWLLPDPEKVVRCIRHGEKSRVNKVPVIDPIARSNMNAHFGDAFANWLAIPEISQSRTTKACQDSGFRFLVRQ